jgi:hypothetical protein
MLVNKKESEPLRSLRFITFRLSPFGSIVIIRQTNRISQEKIIEGVIKTVYAWTVWKEAKSGWVMSIGNQQRISMNKKETGAS